MRHLVILVVTMLDLVLALHAFAGGGAIVAPSSIYTSRHGTGCQLSAAPALTAPPVAGLGDSQQLLATAWLDLRRNEAAHLRDVEQSPQLGYAPIQYLPPASELPPVAGFAVNRCATGMGSACPFAAHDPHGSSPLPLVFRTDAPLLTAEECQGIIDVASAHINSGGDGSGFTLADTNRNLAVADLPPVLEWLNRFGLPRVAAISAECFGERAIGPAHELLVYRALVVQYEHAAGLTHQEVHRDGSLVTCVVTLNEPEAYTGGGTYIEALDTPFALPRGHALLQASALRHAGHAITSGERWVLVLFLISREMRYGEHVRHFKARAQRASDEGDAATEQRCLTLARALCDDTDHELLYDQAVAAHQAGALDEARVLYERALDINDRDSRVYKNLAAVLRQLGLIS